MSSVALGAVDVITTILFDLDGTLIDSEPLAFQAILDCAKEWGLSIKRADAAFVAGKKWELAFDHLYSRYSFPIPKEEASERIVGRYIELVRGGQLGIVPGGAEAVRSFAAAGLRLALVSGSHHADVVWALEKLDIKQHFEVIYGAEDYARSKPAPDGYEKAMRTMNVNPREVLVFEDSLAGIESGKVAGCKVVAITSTNHFQHDQSRADERIVDLRGVTAEWLRKRFP
jgi:beta-phosphoglucomutase